MDIPAHARMAHKGLPQNRLEEELSWSVPNVRTTTQMDKEVK